MKKKATLLIQQPEAVYTMYPKAATILHHAFIAVFHDRILKVGIGSGSEFIDKDTIIIDGRNKIAVPGLIDVAFKSELLTQENVSSAYLHTISGLLMRHGTLLLHCENLNQRVKEQLKHPSMIDIHDQSRQGKAEVVYPFKHLCNNKAPFCISCGYDEIECLDQWLCAKLYARNHPEINVVDILAACTRNPAQELMLKDYGILKQGAKANILLFSGNELSQIMNRFYGDEIIHVIKDGIRFYPIR